MDDLQNEHRYHPFYCEENIWWLARTPGLAKREKWAVFVSNSNQTCAVWSQRVAPEGQAVVWDYHVVLAVRARAYAPVEVWDLDSRLPLPCSAATWLKHSFPGSVPRRFAPRFRVVSSSVLEAHFASDRRHMRGDDGAWLKPPPDWPCIVARSGARHTLDAFVDVGASGPGTTMDLKAFAQWAGSGPVQA